MKRNRIFFLLVLFALLACQNESVTTQPKLIAKDTDIETITAREKWWDDAIFYEIFVRSFYDSDGDGIGDFNGITQKLNYLQDLGVTAIWLMPIHPSPSYHGYDVLNYYAVNHEYGNLDDFRHLLDEAHQRGIHVIIDFVLNHTSSAHPFFVESNDNLDSPYRDWYIWSEKDPGNGWHPGNYGYYYGLFWSGMPDLNYENPAVTLQMEQVTTFWLDEIGVDGFRLDAAKHLIEEGDQIENTTATHDWFRDFYEFYTADHPDAYTVGEIYGAGGFIASTYRQQIEHIFNFELASGFVNSANGSAKSGVISAYDFTLKDMTDGAFATFLTNHDQNRVMSVMNGNIGKAKVAASLLLTAPGTPFIYYGEEIGMQGQKPDEDIRLPMQWSAAQNAGFSTGKPWRAVHADYPQVNLAAQHDDPDSLWKHYQRLINLRKQIPALRTGNTVIVETDDNALFASLRTTNEDQILVIVNLGDDPISNYNLSLESSPLDKGDFFFEGLFGNLDSKLHVVENGVFSLDVSTPLEPFQTLVINLQMIE
jgi:glycosidase